MIKKQSQLQKGITLIEMLVVVGIFSVVSTILLFNYSDFSTGVSIRNLAQEIALSVRKAQTYATSVQSIQSGTTSSYPGFGISFSPDPQNGLTPYGSNQKQFVLFANFESFGIPDSLKTYQSGSTCGNPSVGDECLEQFTILQNDKVIGFRLSNQGDVVSTGRVDISFKRPSPDATICYVTQSGVCNLQSWVEIIIESAKGVRRSVIVYATGQIAVQ